MFKGYIPAGSYTSGTNIPIIQSLNSNSIYQLSNNTISIAKAGVTDIKATIVFEATDAGLISAQLYADGSVVSNASVSTTATAASTYTFVIDYPLLISSQANPDLVTISLQLNGNATLVSGNVNLEYRS